MNASRSIWSKVKSLFWLLQIYLKKVLDGCVATATRLFLMLLRTNSVNLRELISWNTPEEAKLCLCKTIGFGCGKTPSSNYSSQQSRERKESCFHSTTGSKQKTGNGTIKWSPTCVFSWSAKTEEISETLELLQMLWFLDSRQWHPWQMCQHHVSWQTNSPEFHCAMEETSYNERQEHGFSSCKCLEP